MKELWQGISKERPRPKRHAFTRILETLKLRLDAGDKDSVATDIQNGAIGKNPARELTPQAMDQVSQGFCKRKPSTAVTVSVQKTRR